MIRYFSTRKSSAGGSWSQHFRSLEAQEEQEALLAEYKQSQEEGTHHRTNQTLECTNLKGNELLGLLIEACANKEISGFYFKNCELSGAIRNQISILVYQRYIKKIGFESCNLCSDDMLWLNAILNPLYGIESFTLVENLSSEEYFKIYTNLSVRNLKHLGFPIQEISTVSCLLHTFDKLESIRIFIDNRLSRDQINDILSLINKPHIKALHLVPLEVEGDGIYQQFIQGLKQNRSLQRLIIGDYPGIENDLVMMLLDNRSLTSVSIENRQHHLPSANLDKIESLTKRNVIFYQANSFLAEQPDEDLDDEEREILSTKSRLLINALNNVRQTHYNSSSENETKELIQKIEDFKTDLNRSDKRLKN